MTFGGVPTVPVSDVPDPSDEAVLLDVREDDEWAVGHAPGAIHIPMGDIPSRVGDLSADANLFVVCRVGGRSARVVEYLVQAGYDAVNVDGGMIAWQSAGRPLTRDDGQPATV